MGYRTWMMGLCLLAMQESQAQGKTIRVMLQQLAALKGYAGTVEKGYRLAEDGLHLVRDLKSGEFHLHQVFFGSLQRVDEAVLRWPEASACYEKAAKSKSAFDEAASIYAVSGWLHPEELTYVGQIRTEVARRDQDDLEALKTLTSDGALAMTDGERIGQIERVAQTIGTRFRNVQVFLAGLSWLIAQRQKEMAFTGTLKKMYGLD
ncbi:hypothetical protein Q4E93_21910 [Flavitalea sp. BT771]|uniref:hypothetical protein n=1 Tax=Flavitalea sp. BT771 TaxID=3063329 RepID=UPI0026E44264|nr:hypothetical protein [Flavitalea sp. BT771]MDO6433282.1 hypothetical protein [Flavitalea sp. BT771]MDV6222813.1 hypothetical protein [Flavitalea sp. BT771]